MTAPMLVPPTKSTSMPCSCSAWCALDVAEEVSQTLRQQRVAVLGHRRRRIWRHRSSGRDLGPGA
jgi:hypothetical protein